MKKNDKKNKTLQIRALPARPSSSIELSKLSKVTVPHIIAGSSSGNSKIVAVTAYDYTSGLLVDQAGVDVVLVGDSLGNVIQGQDTTLPVTMDEMIYHTRCVKRAVKRALVVGDMPFSSYQISEESALANAFRLVKEGGAEAVKLEGGSVMASTIKKLVERDVPVMGHIGLTPQSVHRMGGYKVQGKDNPQKILDDAMAICQAGAFAIVVEGVPEDLARQITESVSVPTIGIGAGADCNGQILVFHDLLGLTPNKPPKFVKQYADSYNDLVKSVRTYASEVRQNLFPSPEYTYSKVTKIG